MVRLLAETNAEICEEVVVEDGVSCDEASLADSEGAGAILDEDSAPEEPPTKVTAKPKLPSTFDETPRAETRVEDKTPMRETNVDLPKKKRVAPAPPPTNGTQTPVKEEVYKSHIT